MVEGLDVTVLGGEGIGGPGGHEGVDAGAELGGGSVEPEEEDQEVTAEDGVADLGQDGVGTAYEIQRMAVEGPAIIVGQEGGDQKLGQGVGLAVWKALLRGVVGTKFPDNVAVHDAGVMEKLVVVLDVVVVGGVAELEPAAEAESG